MRCLGLPTVGSSPPPAGWYDPLTRSPGLHMLVTSVLTHCRGTQRKSGKKLPQVVYQVFCLQMTRWRVCQVAGTVMIGVQ